MDLRKGEREQREDELERVVRFQNRGGGSGRTVKGDCGGGRQAHVRNWDEPHVMTSVNHSAQKGMVCCAD